LICRILARKCKIVAGMTHAKKNTTDNCVSFTVSDLSLISRINKCVLEKFYSSGVPVNSITMRKTSYISEKVRGA
jgi:hypothetical protein